MADTETKALDNTELPPPLTAADYRANAAVEAAAATQSLLIAIVLGMVSVKAIDADVLRTYLATLYSELGPIERHQAYGAILSAMLAAIGTPPTPTPTARAN
jgi:hypothetical protein